MRFFRFIVLYLISHTVLAVNTSIIFKENKGQWPDQVLFGAQFVNTKFYVNKTGFNYCVYNFEELSNAYKARNKKSIVHGHNYEVNFEGANLSSFEMKDKLTEYYNYFLGNNKSKWVSHVKACSALKFNDVYSGIDLNIYSSSINLKYDFIISPNADPTQIKLNYGFIDRIEIRNGQLVITTSVGEVIEKAPFTYQIINGKKKVIECEYVLKGNSVGFRFPKGYNKNYELVIDPVVLACSYSGTPVFAYATACNYDSNGNIYLTGDSDIGYPTTIGAFQINAVGNGDIFVSAYSSNGSSKLFSTYIGGTYSGVNYYETSVDIHVSNKEITLLGTSPSLDYPCSYNAFDTIFNGATDIVLTKLDITGSSLIASTFVGGTLNENIYQLGYSPGAEMVIDKQKNIYVVSNSTSPDFPVTAGAQSTTLSGPSDAVVFKMDSTLTKLVWSTYLGGSAKEDGISIKGDATGGVFLSGTTSSADFPTTTGAYSTVKLAFEDMFVSHLNNTGTSLIASTFLGTNTQDWAFLMTVDPFYNVYVCGHIASTTPGLLIATAGTYSTNSQNSLYKLDSSLNNLGFKTLFGPSPTQSYLRELYTSAFKVDSCGNIYIAGTAWIGHPTTPDKFQLFSGGGGTDMYMIVFNPNCTSIRFASYYGANVLPPTGFSAVGEQSWGISHIDDRGILYQAVSASENLPTTAGAYYSSYNDTVTGARIYNDAFLKIDLGTFVNANSSYGANIIGCPAPFTANFVSTTNTGTTYWDFGDGNTSVEDTISHTYLNLGTYNVLLVVTDTATCNKTDSIKSILSVINPTAFDLGDDIYKCPDSPLLLKSNVAAVSYLWSTGQTSQNISVNQPGTFTLIIYNGGCYTSDEITVLMGEDAWGEKFPNVITPNNDGVNDLIDFSKYKFEEMEFILFDRWGKQRYKITNPNEKWLSENLNNDTYFYVINYKSNCTEKYSTAKGIISVFK